MESGLEVELANKWIKVELFVLPQFQANIQSQSNVSHNRQCIVALCHVQEFQNLNLTKKTSRYQTLERTRCCQKEAMRCRDDPMLPETEHLKLTTMQPQLDLCLQCAHVLICRRIVKSWWLLQALSWDPRGDFSQVAVYILNFTALQNIEESSRLSTYISTLSTKLSYF